MAEEPKVHKEVCIESYADMSRVNASIMEEIARDKRIPPMDRMRGIRMGIQNQSSITKDRRYLQQDAVKFGKDPASERLLQIVPESKSDDESK